MTMKSRLSLSLALAIGALLFAFLPAAGAKPTILDSYCSPSGDICQEIDLTKKNGKVKFSLLSSTASVMGDYTLCVKGSHGKKCKDFVLEQLPDEELWADTVVWQENFPTDVGRYIVKWKYQGDRLGKKLRFKVGGPVEG